MRTLFISVLIFASIIGAGQTLINVGTSANDGTGDNLRAAFQKVNANFTEIYDSAQWISRKFTTGFVILDSVDMTLSGWNKVPIELKGGYYVDSIRLIAVGAASDVDLTFRYSSSMADTGTVIKYTYTLTSTTTPVVIAAYKSVPANSVTWVKPTELTTKPRRIAIQLIGHKIN